MRHTFFFFEAMLIDVELRRSSDYSREEGIQRECADAAIVTPQIRKAIFRDPAQTQTPISYCSHNDVIDFTTSTPTLDLLRQVWWTVSRLVSELSLAPLQTTTD